MKNLALITFFICFLAKTNGQNYIPFPTVNTTWETVTQFTDPGNPCYSYEFAKTNGDTIINGQQYTIINRLNFLTTFIRENNGLVYCKYQNNDMYDTTEFLLYNFNLQVGDTMQMAMTGYELMFTTGHVDYIDSILIGTTSHKKIGISGWHHIDFIEGVGSLQGLLYPEISLVDWMSDLTCFSRNDTIFSLTGGGATYNGNCWQFVDIREPKINKIIVSPNPTNDFLRIIGPTITKAELFTMNGQKILETTLQNINLMDYERGIYLLKVYSADRSVENFKIVKE
jgi:hypothetical protein